jgi:hypothetical protein
VFLCSMDLRKIQHVHCPFQILLISDWAPIVSAFLGHLQFKEERIGLLG